MNIKFFSVAAFAAMALAACATDTSQPTKRDGPPPRGETSAERPAPNFADAAGKLGVTEEELKTAMREAGGPPPDLDAVADKLGVSVDDLKAALPKPPKPR